MICQTPKCSGILIVCNTYTTGSGKTQRLECPVCLTVYTAIVVLVNSNPAHGQGAAALAKQLANGKEFKWTFGDS